MTDRDLSKWFDEAKRDGNPLLTHWLALAAVEEHFSELFISDRHRWEREFGPRIQEGRSEYIARRDLTAKYAWAIPCEAALAVVRKYSPLVEIGAGTGYWAWLLRKRGADILAFDYSPPGAKPTGSTQKNNYHGTSDCWVKVRHGGPSEAARHKDRALFLCWPPYDDPMAAECLEHYRGSTVIYVGEGEGGCTANYAFFAALKSRFEMVEEVELPQFDGVHDWLGVWRCL